MIKRIAMQALACLVIWTSARAWATGQPYSFTGLDRARMLLMNNDNNTTCPVTLQGYNDTSPTKGFFWTHTGDAAPTDSSLIKMNLKDGTHHTYHELVSRADLGGAVLYSTNILWELVNCRAGSCVYQNSSTTSPRNWIPWQNTAVDIDGTAAIAVNAYTKAGMISMQNTTAACIYSPLYTDGIGTIYFDAVNGWPSQTGTLVLEIATNTVDGTELTRETTQAAWQVLPADVLVVAGPSARRIVALRADGRHVEEIALRSTAKAAVTLAQAAKATGGTGGSFFYRVRANLDWRGPVRFRIRRLDTSASSFADTEAYLIVDNILVSPPPVEAEFIQYGKGYDASRLKTRILGWEGALTYPFAFAGQEGVTPWMRYAGRASDYYSGVPADWLLSDVKFHYRWTYLGLDSTPWKTIEMVKNGVKYFAREGQSLDLSEGLGDIEFYYSAQIDRAPHYDPVDYACGSAITNTANIAGKTCKMPYGADWYEGQKPWRMTCRRRASEGPLPSGGTDWFVRVREGKTMFEDMALVVTNTVDGGSASNIWMELVGNRLWRAYYYMPTNMAGKTIKFHFAGFNRQTQNRNETFETNTNAWYLGTEKVPYLPYNGAADGRYAAEVRLDLASTHLLFEFDESTRAFAVSHAAYQDFNMWTDAAKGYMGYYSTTAAVSEAKRTYTEDFASWRTSTALSDYWSENFDVTGDIPTNSPFFPGVEFTTGRRTPHGWTADNGMFVCQTLTNSAAGLSLALQGCGRGAVALANVAASDVPAGLGVVDVSARISQPHVFDNFAWSINGLKAKDYAFTAKVNLSTQRGTDMSEGDPSVSIVGYYRPYAGCYEARARRVTQLGIEFSLWKWEQQGGALQARQLGSKYMAPNGGAIWSAYPLVNFTTANNFSSWHTIALSMCNTPTGTVVQARLARVPRTETFQKDRPSSQGGTYNDQLYLIVTAVDNTNPLTCGTYGAGTVNCMGYMGYPELRDITDPTKNPTNYPFNGGQLLTQEFTDGDWVLPGGRYRHLQNANGKNEIQYFRCGICAVLPQQELLLQVCRAGDSDASEWLTVGRETITNFLATPYHFEPMVTDDSYVRLTTGGSSHDLRTDVAVDDITLGSWRGRDYPAIGNNYGQRTNWVYTSCWIESAVGLEGAYAVQAVPGANEFCYIFTNAGRTVTFTPREDMYLSQALVVGGGGAGGWGSGGGGGGGGVYALTNGTVLKAGVPVTIAVGAGGNNYFSSRSDYANIMRGDNGGASRLTIGDGAGGFDDYIAYGGGGGGSYSMSQGYGNNWYGTEVLATGGGRSANANDTPNVGRQATGAKTAKGKNYGQGGGGDGGNGQLFVAGGGGGAGGHGGNGTTNNLEWLDAKHALVDIEIGDGGPGFESAITGKATYYGGGGGGGDGLLYVNTADNANFTVDGHKYYGYYGDHSPWNSKAYLVRNSNARLGEYGNRFGGKGGLGGGGDGAPRALLEPGKGSDGANGFGGGGGGGCSTGYGVYRPGGRGGDGAVILRIRGLAQHQCVIQPTRGRYTAPVGIRSPWLENGLGLVRFSYASADTNAVLLLQVSTNMASYTELYQRTSQLDANWMTLTNFTFRGADERMGTKAAYVSLRAPVKGVLRLIADPDVVRMAQQQNDPSYGLVAITSIMCYDEPILDARSWTGWNMWTTGWDGQKPNEFAYLYDGLWGYSCSLNWSAILADNLTGITGLGSDLAEPEKTISENEYAKSYPYVQGPAMTNGIGYVKFRARMMTPDQETPSVVTLFGLTRPDDAESAEEITNIVVDARRWKQYSWKSTADHSDYMAIRLAVKGAQGEGGRNFPEPAYYMDGTPIGKLQRVMIDEVAFSEPIAPRLALLNARPFRNGITEKGVITNILEVAQQPLIKESFGFQVELQPQQLADDIDFSSIRVFVAYYPGKNPWGWRNWTNEAAAVRAELKRAAPDALVWRSTYENAASVAAAQAEPGTVVQYFLWTVYNDNAGKPHVHELDAVDWDGGPSWYWPIDLNKTFGGNDPNKFSAYTILDSISPKRAWINEVNYYDDYDIYTGYTAETNQFIELAVPGGADLSGWWLRVQDRTRRPVALCTLGANGVDKSTVANMVNHYSFFTLASPKTVAAGTLGAAVSGRWKSSDDLSSANVAGGVFNGREPYALELIRPSGVIEHQIVIEGTNNNRGAWGWQTSGTNLCNELKANSAAGSSWFFAGSDDGPGTLGVYTNHGESAACWTNRMVATPARINARQTIDPEWYLPPSSDFVWIYATILGEHMYVVDGANTNASGVFMLGRGGSTNITFTLDKWFETDSVTVNGKAVAGAAGHARAWSLPLVNVTNTIDVYASARLSSAITGGIDPRDPYFNAVTDWLLQKEEEPIYPARFIAYTGSVTNELSLKQMYWLDIPPTEPGWIFRAGMCGAPVDPSRPIRQPCEPIIRTNDVTGALCTNVRVTVFLQLTNEVTGVWHTPQYLRGLTPGETSYGYTGRPNWTGVTFRVVGALQNGIANDVWVPLRWFVFGPESFDPVACTASIEILDPFSIASPAAYERWNEYPGCNVFYRWQFGETPSSYATEMLKKDMINE